MASAFRDGLSPKTMNTMEYRRIQAKLFHIRTCLSHFALFNPTRSEIKKCLSHQPSSASILEKTLGNLFQIHSELLLLLRQHVEMSLWRLADSKLDDATIVLRDIIKDAVERKISFNGSLSPQNFRRLGPTQWLDDEIINYFVERWCSQSQTTLGFTTFFAETFLFQNSGPYCTVARTIFNRSQAEKLDRWYSKRLAESTWPSPVASSLHSNKRGSLSLDKPITQRKNTGLMLALMWVTERLGSFRDEVVQLANNPHTDWKCRPHVKVRFQPNGHDCGIFMLWSLRDVLGMADEYGFSDSHLVVKRLRLAQQILDDHGQI
ncbi:hypothetical protein K435DRAFT_854861 [Dendrothele bispora CBS 962.96]|uniref:Ubiquitin-like protease family profile domain-containing protein n=1 Tax=Dendrothele bispora (strain CBS 962.96) TaxID=1314807 RepID=A0A4S8MEB6_DENBC|nr:hypothetical protein K435DRAFT_854861 [Dendrothele bispora CBS 962.96]